MLERAAVVLLEVAWSDSVETRAGSQATHQEVACTSFIPLSIVSSHSSRAVCAWFNGRLLLYLLLPPAWAQIPSLHLICSRQSLLGSWPHTSASSHALFFHLSTQVRAIWQEDTPETLQKLRSSCVMEGSKHAVPANRNGLGGYGPLSPPPLLVFCAWEDRLSCFPLLASLTHHTDEVPL